MNDLISRKAAIEIQAKYAEQQAKYAEHIGSTKFGQMRDDINALPSVKPQEPFMNKPCVAHQICHEDKIKVLDKIRSDVINIADGKQSIKVRSVLRIIDKYKAESEVE